MDVRRMVNLRGDLALVAAVVLALSLAGPGSASGQPIWIGLNFEVHLKADGTAIVIIREHPFALNGTSLFGDQEVLLRMLQEAEINRLYAALMFASSPEHIETKLVGPPEISQNDTVLADPLNKGQMVEYRGAVVTRVLVNLSTAEYVRDLGDGRYEIKIVDPFTARDPRSWIDVLKVSWDEGVEVLGVDWVPSSASGPTEQGDRYLLWLNYNEPSAPDAYVLTARFPGMVVAPPPGLTVKLEASRAGDVVEVRVSSDGVKYVVTRIVGPGEDQARGVSLEPGEWRTVRFYSDAPSLRAEVYVGGRKVVEAPVSEGSPTGLSGGNSSVSSGPLPALLLVLGILVVLAGLSLGSRMEGKEREEETQFGWKVAWETW